MAENEKKQPGDGQDNYMNAAKQGAQAIKNTSKAIGGKAAAKGAEAVANSAAATVKAGAQAGKAVANIAAGTAAGGPWGAIISAAWSMRHTLFKVLVSIGLAIVFLVILIISLPAIIFDSIFGLPDDYSGNSLNAAYTELSRDIRDTVNSGYSYALGRVDSIIADGGYDYEMSMDSLTDYSNGQAEYDTCYVLALYSASMHQSDATSANMLAKMNSIIDQMFRVTYEVLQVRIPILSDLLEIIGYKIVSFVKCVIHPFDSSFFLNAFNVDLDAQYGEFDITYGEAVDYMAEALRLTLEGSESTELGGGV